MTRILLLFGFIFFVATSCDQTMLGVGSAIKNVVTAPYRGIRDSLRAREYEKIQKTTIDNKVINAEQEYCDYMLKQSIEAPLNELEDLKDDVQNQLCTCVAWGNCTKDLCSCEKLCPTGFGIFNHAPMDDIKSLSLDENSLAFRNNNISSTHKKTKGYCWGHASVTSKFNRLAFFKPSRKPPYNLDSKDPIAQKRALKIYKEIIDKVVDNQAVSIPGFANLKELSAHPLLETYIADKIATSWADNAMTFQGVTVATGTKSPTNEAAQKLIDDVATKLENFQQPQIVFTELGKPYETHTVLVSHVVLNDKGEKELCIRDNNNNTDSNYKCENKIYLDNRGKLVYKDRNIVEDLGSTSITHNENSESVLQQKSLLTRCNKLKKCI